MRSIFGATFPGAPDVQWREMRCVRCGCLLERIEENALRPGKRLKVECTECKLINDIVGAEPDDA
jgi:phage FluMu protein Com